MLIDCPKCKASVDGRENGSVCAYPLDEPFYRVSLLACPRCLLPLVAGQDYLGESEFDGTEIWSRDTNRLWPLPSINLSSALPVQIRSSLEEADKCFRAGAFTASVAMSGRAIEAMCRHFKTKSQYLAGGLKELLDQGVIDKRLFQWSEELRIHRNIAAHATDTQLSHEEAEDLFNFSTAICDYVFVLNEKFEKFMQRKSNKKSVKFPSEIAE